MRRGGGRGRGPGPGRGGGRMVRRQTRMMVRRHHRRRRRRRRRRIILVGGLIALGAYKLSKPDVEKIEEHTGKSAEELSDEELDQAIGELGIEGQELEDNDYDYIDEQADEPDYLDELERLAQLRDQGILTDQEFEMKKKQLLDM